MASSTIATTSISDSLARIQAALRDIISATGHKVRHNLSKPRPWAEFLDYSAFFNNSNSPINDTMSMMDRIIHNMTYFSSNYTAFAILIALFALFSSPLPLIALCILLKARSLFDELVHEEIHDRKSIDPRDFAILVIITSVIVFTLATLGIDLAFALIKAILFVLIHAATYRVSEERLLPYHVRGSDAASSDLENPAPAA